MSYDLLSNNPDTYKLKTTIRTTKKRFQMTLIRSIQSLAYLEFGVPKQSVYPISKTLKHFPKKKHNLALPKKVSFIAKKIDILTFSKEYLAQKDKYFTPRKVKEKRLKEATFYWLEYSVKNIANYTKYEKYYTEANYRLAQAYDKNLKDKNLGNEYSQEKVFKYLNNIVMLVNNPLSTPFSRYLVKNNYLNDINIVKSFIKKSIYLSQQNNTKYLGDYFSILDLPMDSQAFILYKKLSKNIPQENWDTSTQKDEQNYKKSFDILMNIYKKEPVTSLDWYNKYIILKYSYLFNTNPKDKYISPIKNFTLSLENSFIKKQKSNKKRLLVQFLNKAKEYNNITIKSNYQKEKLHQVFKEKISWTHDGDDLLLPEIYFKLENQYSALFCLSWDYIGQFLKAMIEK